MSKQMSNQKMVYKINSKRFRINDWNLTLSIDEAKKNEEIVPLGSSITLRMIRDLNKSLVTEEDIFKCKKEIKKLRKEIKNEKNKAKAKTALNKKYKELDKMCMYEDYLVVVFDTIADWDVFNSKKQQVFLNGKEYIRLVGTNGGVKNSSVVFCSKRIHNKLDKKMNNGRNPKQKYVPAKFESYKALSCSVSNPVTHPKGVLVIQDGETEFTEDVLLLSQKQGEGNEDRFDLKEVKNFNIKRAFTDGCGMILKRLSEQWAIDLGEYHLDENRNKVANYIPTGFNIRNSWTKGMVFTFPFDEFAEEIAHNYMVKDAWGNMIDIRNVELVITTNMLKLWNSYDSIEHYLSCCEENGYEFCVAKILPQELETTRNMNYQFLQSYDFTDEDIAELIKPTIDDIKGAVGGHYGKTLLYMQGRNLGVKDFENAEYNYIKALMVSEKMIEDPFIKQRVYRMIEKKINDAKKGVIQVKGNYSIVSGDLYALCEYMFGMEVKGLLKANEFYAHEWVRQEVYEVVGFRAPMSIHNNIKVLKLINNELIKKWFRYMKTCTVFNAWDTSMDIFNGLDYDGDALITTNNPVLLRRTKPTLPVICEQKSVEKKIITETLLRNANKNGFGNEVGSVTNKCTAMYDIMAKFAQGSKEWEEMLYRTTCMQGYQQEVIDSVKGCIAKKVPKEWYDASVLVIKEDDTEEEKERKLYLQKLVSNKKPYFFIYNYSHIRTEYVRFVKDYEKKALFNFKLTLEELLNKEDRNELEQKVVDNYYKYMPISLEPSTMNRICWKIEEELKDLKMFSIQSKDFDREYLKFQDVKYNNSMFSKVEELYKAYKINFHDSIKNAKAHGNDDFTSLRKIAVEEFYRNAMEVCLNEEKMTNIVIDLCYKGTDSKQFAWDICGEIITEDLLRRNNYEVNIPIICSKDEQEFTWQGESYKMIRVERREKE